MLGQTTVVGAVVGTPLFHDQVRSHAVCTFPSVITLLPEVFAAARMLYRVSVADVTVDPCGMPERSNRRRETISSCEPSDGYQRTSSQL